MADLVVAINNPFAPTITYPVVAYYFTPKVGYGAKYTNPTMPANRKSTDVAFCGKTELVITHTVAPYVSAFPWTSGVGFGTIYADPVTTPTGPAYAVAFCGNTDVAIAHSGSPFVSAYPWTPGVGFGAKYADPATLPTSVGQSVAFCGNTDIAVGHNWSPYVSAYPWTPGVGFGVKYANPAALPDGPGRGIAFCGNTDIVIAHLMHPHVSAYPWTPGVGFGVRYADPATEPGASSSAAFVGTTTLILGTSRPGLCAYAWTPGVGFGAKYPDPADDGATGGPYCYVGHHISILGDSDIAVADWDHSMALPWTPGVGFGAWYALPEETYEFEAWGVAFMGGGVAPTISAISPGTGAQRSVIEVTVTGTELTDSYSLNLGTGVTAVMSSTTETSATFAVTITEFAATGPRDVVLTTPYGSATIVNGFTVTIYIPDQAAVSTLAATNVAESSAVLNGVVNENRNETVIVWFDWGGTTQYGQSTAKQSVANKGESFAATLISLGTGTFHYRAVLQGSKGVVYGQDMTFSTLSLGYPPTLILECDIRLFLMGG